MRAAGVVAADARDVEDKVDDPGVRGQEGGVEVVGVGLVDQRVPLLGDPKEQEQPQHRRPEQNEPGDGPHLDGRKDDGGNVRRHSDPFGISGPCMLVQTADDPRRQRLPEQVKEKDNLVQEDRGQEHVWFCCGFA